MELIEYRPHLTKWTWARFLSIKGDKQVRVLPSLMLRLHVEKLDPAQWLDLLGFLFPLWLLE